MGSGVTSLIGHELLAFVEETGSTNSDLLDRLVAGLPVTDGEWLIAARQSAGRGRLGRVWDSRTGNFHGSTVVNLQPADPPPHTLALVAAIALHDAVTDCTRGMVPAAIKWPNDLLIDGAKVAGIWAERQGSAIVVGIGVNLAYAPEIAGRQTVSLADLGHSVPVRQFAASLAQNLTIHLGQWREQGLSATVERWNSRALAAGTSLSISDGPQAGLTGGFDGLEQDGNLRLKLDDGRRVIINAGEVRLAGQQAELGDG